LSVQDLQRPCTAKWWGADVKLPKTLVLVAGFLFWSANQLWPHSPRAPVFNDIAIALFALDVVLVIVGRPPVTWTKSRVSPAPTDLVGGRRGEEK